mmetsp:Transcript_51567/g.159775  ORF Transcript_51567/g.159775 Transcript_51567/m.159775 type:complete len:227 (-) Transcript_51567:217-897(-)
MPGRRAWPMAALRGHQAGVFRALAQEQHVHQCFHACLRLRIQHHGRPCSSLEGRARCSRHTGWPGDPQVDPERPRPRGPAASSWPGRPGPSRQHGPGREPPQVAAGRRRTPARAARFKARLRRASGGPLQSACGAAAAAMALAAWQPRRPATRSGRRLRGGGGTLRVGTSQSSCASAQQRSGKPTRRRRRRSSERGRQRSSSRGWRGASWRGASQQRGGGARSRRR